MFLLTHMLAALMQWRIIVLPLVSIWISTLNILLWLCSLHQLIQNLRILKNRFFKSSFVHSFNKCLHHSTLSSRHWVQQWAKQTAYLSSLSVYFSGGEETEDKFGKYNLCEQVLSAKKQKFSRKRRAQVAVTEEFEVAWPGTSSLWRQPLRRDPRRRREAHIWDPCQAERTAGQRPSAGGLPGVLEDWEQEQVWSGCRRAPGTGQGAHPWPGRS